MCRSHAVGTTWRVEWVGKERQGIHSLTLRHHLRGDPTAHRASADHEPGTRCLDGEVSCLRNRGTPGRLEDWRTVGQPPPRLDIGKLEAQRRDPCFGKLL